MSSLICLIVSLTFFSFFFFNDTATTEIYTLSLHDALPICLLAPASPRLRAVARSRAGARGLALPRGRRLPAFGAHSRSLPRHLPDVRSEEHTSELQSRLHLVCRLLLEKKKQNNKHVISHMSDCVTYVFFFFFF